MTQQSHSWAYIWTKLSLKKTHAPACSIAAPRHGNNQNVHQQMIGFRRCGTYTQWNTSQPLKKNKIMPFAATWMELETLILSEVKSERERQIPYDITYIWNLI